MREEYTGVVPAFFRALYFLNKYASGSGGINLKRFSLIFRHRRFANYSASGAWAG